MSELFGSLRKRLSLNFSMEDANRSFDLKYQWPENTVPTWIVNQYNR